MSDVNRVLSFGGRSGRGLLALCLMPCLAVVGCRPAADSGEAKPAPAKSSLETLADGITGKYAVDAGKRAKADIEAIAAKKNAELEEALEE